MKEKIMAICLFFARGIYGYSLLLRVFYLVAFLLLLVAMLRERKFASPYTDEEMYGYLRRVLSWPWLIAVLLVDIADALIATGSIWFDLLAVFYEYSVIAIFLLRYWLVTVMLNERMKSEKEAESK